MASNAEQALVDELFAPDIGMEASGLNSKDNYVAFAKQVGDILYEGQAPYHVPAFYAELTRGLTRDISAEDVKKIVDSVTLIYNKKLAEKKGGGKKANDKKKGKATLAAGKGTDNSRNNNPAMIADLMGDDYGEEDETAANAKRVAEDADPNDDFM